MDFTFGIITAGNNDKLINEIIDSIELENIPNYEILIMGNSTIDKHNTKIIPFDETIKNGWITKKKNIITQNSKFENIVFMHDYIKLTPGWYEGQIISGNDFNIRMDKIIDYNGIRYRDWVCWCHNPNSHFNNLIGRDCLIPYDMIHLSKYMYISGAYWVAKKSVMLELPLNENLLWGQGEDIEFSFRYREKYTFKMNEHSTVKLIKDGKDRVFNEPNEEKIQLLKNFK